MGAAAMAGADAAQPPRTLVVRVVDAATGRPLPNADVEDLARARRRLTDADGVVRVARGGDGAAPRVRVRQIGYRPVETAGTAADTGDTLTVPLRRVAVALAPVRVTGSTRCPPGSAEAERALAVPAFGALRDAAERWSAFRRAYPHRLDVERRTLWTDPAGGRPRLAVDRYRADARELEQRYRPGEVVDRTGRGFEARVLFVSALADARFWERHCFAAQGVEPLGAGAVRRIEFSRALGERGTDWEGYAFLDTASGLLRRVEFRLRSADRDPVPARLEGYTTFVTASPFVVVPESTAAVWWHTAPADGVTWGDPEAYQTVHIRGLRFRRGAPPAADTARGDGRDSTVQGQAGREPAPRAAGPA